MPKRSPYPTVGAAPPLKKRIVAGAAAGDIAVTGIKAVDKLQYVGGIKQDGSAVLADLTSEFTITADGTINNVGGTATTGFNLIVEWFQWPTQLG